MIQPCANILQLGFSITFPVFHLVIYLSSLVLYIAGTKLWGCCCIIYDAEKSTKTGSFLAGIPGSKVYRKICY